GVGMSQTRNTSFASKSPDMTPVERRAFARQQVEMLFQQLPLILLADIIAGGFLFAVFLSASDRPQPLFWVSVLVIITVIRAFLARECRERLAQATDITPYRHFLIGGALLSGIIWGNAWLLLPTNPEFIQITLVSVWLAGMIAGAATTMTMIRPVFLAFTVTAGACFITYLLLAVEENSLVLAGAYAMYIGFILPIAYRISREFNQTIQLQIRNAELSRTLDEDARRLQDKEQELAIQMERGDLLQTEKDSATEKLRFAAEEKALLLDAIGEGVFGLDNQGYITFTNTSALHMLRCTEADFLHESVMQFIIADEMVPQQDESYRAIADCFRNGSPVHNIEAILTGKDELKVPVRLSCTPIEENGGSVGAVMSFADVSEQKDMEAMLLQSQKMEAIGRLTGGVAHDFNNLLTVILGNLQFLKRQLGANEQALILIEKVIDAARSGGDLNNRLLSFSREQTLDKEVILIDELFDEMRIFLVRLLGENIDLDIQVSDQDCTVIADRTQLQNALLNLCVNARDAMPEGGRLTIAARTLNLPRSFIQGDQSRGEADYVEVSVTDNGTGIPQTILKHIFEPFFSTKSKDRGSGLGLATVYGFIRQSGGNITVDSREGEWTRFRIYLPRADTIARKTQRPSAKPLASTQRFEGTVLVVEDDPGVREVAVATLIEAGFEVIAATDGQDGLDKFASNPQIRLVFSDVIMPGGINGIEMAESLLKQKPTLPVILATGYTDRALKDRIMEFSNVIFLSKPYDTEELPGIIQSMMMRRVS
ncbi:MAG: ATP-binding protein, partial [Pseudohongiellaceae bacterium]